MARNYSAFAGKKSFREKLFPRRIERLDYFVRAVLFSLAGVILVSIHDKLFIALAGDPALDPSLRTADLAIWMLWLIPYVFLFVFSAMMPRLADAGFPWWVALGVSIPLLNALIGLACLLLPTNFARRR